MNWEEQDWQLEASRTQLLPRNEGFGGNPIFSNIILGQKRELKEKYIQEDECDKLS